MVNLNSDGVYKIKPAARLIQTIGSDLIGDPYAALVELVKNSYDADSSKVDIRFNYTNISNETVIVISVIDDGHGMNYDTMINKWLVPATDDKIRRKTSPLKKRVLQGRKGIGRFAAGILGQEMTLISVDKNGGESTIVIDWREFDRNKFLEDVELLVETKKTDRASGTEIKIIAKKENNDDKVGWWDRSSFETLIKELRKLISPFEEFSNDLFEISLTIINSPYDDLNKSFKIETFPVIDLYDYRITGTIDNNGTADLLFENNINPEFLQSENIQTQYKIEGNGKFCGLIRIDFRVFDREAEAIENLINKGLIDPVSKKYMGKNEARRLLNEVYGVNIYKNNFRIRPYGNTGVDWLDLDKDRIQNFTLRISNNQVVGFIIIQSEEFSHLEEKSARDGLKENEYYFGLKELSKKALAELEFRRLAVRAKSKKSRDKKKSVKDSLESLFSLSGVKESISKKLLGLNVEPKSITEIENILEQEEEKKKGLKDEIEKTIAIYQGQATLGKIINFILHEGRKPIQFFNSETKVIERYIRFYKATKDEKVLKELNGSIEGFRDNSKMLSSLFNRISPLAKQNRGTKGHFKIEKTILNSLRIFTESINNNNIIVKVDCDSSIEAYGWEEDLIIALTNLIENSVYWLSLTENPTKEITIRVSEDEDSILLDYKDSGPGLTDLEIESDVIFEPGYSKKLNGTGLGLAIAGEAIERLNGELKARKYNEGAYFQIEINR